MAFADIVNTGSDTRNIEDVPDISAARYRDILSFAHDSPAWLQEFAAVFTEAVLVLFGLALVLAAWRARGRDARTLARALLAPAATVIAYATSEWAKTVKDVGRPCRTLSDVTPLVDCPPPGDFSLPSTHATIAGAVTVGLLLTWRGLGLATVPVAVLAAFSRVFVGVHYPHDVVLGLVLGALVALVLLEVLTRPAAAWVERVRPSSGGRPETPVGGVTAQHGGRYQPRARRAGRFPARRR